MPFDARGPGGKSFRTVALEILQRKQPEQVVPYSELAAAMLLDPRKNRAQIQQAVITANKALLKLNQRGVRSVRNVGYRVLPAREHMLAANGHRSKADRQMRRCIEFFSGTNLSELSPQELRIHQGQAMLASAIWASHQSLDRRIRRLEDLTGLTGVE